MKKKIAILAGIGSALLIGTVGVQASALERAHFENPHIEVTGHAEMSLKADMADVTAVISKEDRSRQRGTTYSQAAFEDFRASVQDALQALKSEFPDVLGNAKVDSPETSAPSKQDPRIEISRITTNPLRTRQNDQWINDGVRYEAVLQVKNIPIDITGRVFNLLSSTENAQSANISNYQSSSASEASNPARIEALKNARKKAEALAKTVGMQIGKPIIIKDMERGYINPQPMARSFNAMAVSASTTSAPDTEVMPGFISVNSTVYAVFPLIDPDKKSIKEMTTNALDSVKNHDYEKHMETISKSYGAFMNEIMRITAEQMKDSKDVVPEQSATPP